jgi:isopenicillin N synthase-like dioxygenase
MHSDLVTTEDTSSNFLRKETKKNYFTIQNQVGISDYAATLPKHQEEIVSHLTEVSVQIITMSLPLITSFLNDAEKRTGQEDLTQDALSAQDHYVLRYLHYFPSSDTQEEIAAAHCDIGGFTLHLAQDIPGLQFLHADGFWKDVVFDGNKTIIFPGIGMQYRTKGQIKATCHRVVSNAESREIGRYSSVLFANWSTGGRWNKEKYGGLSEQTPGFNYDLSHEEMLKFIDDEKDFSGV